MKRYTLATAVLLGAVCVSMPGLGQAQDYPTRRITLDVPYGAGSTSDIFARIMAEGLSAKINQPVVVENRPGAGGTVGTGQAVRAPDDGYTLVVIVTSSIAINGSLYNNLTFDPSTDIEALSIPSTTSNALVVSKSSGIETVEQLIEQAQATPPARYNSPGNGTSQHLSGVLFSRLAEIEAEHIPYRGQEGITGMLGGQTLFGFATLPSVSGLVRGDRLSVLATTGAVPAEAYPDIPTLSSIGMTDFGYGEIWYGIGIRSSTSEPIKEKLAAVFVDVAKDPAIQKQLADIGFAMMPEMDAQQRKDFVAEQVKFWGDLVTSAGVTVSE